MKHIGIYPRKSVYRDNSESVSVQIKLCKEYSKIIYPSEEIQFHVYARDEGFTGKNTNRPSYQDLMCDVRSNKLDVVMVYRLDRISRNVQEFSAMFTIFQEHNVAFVSVKESFDTSTPIGRTVMYILAAFAQLERENISERVTDNMQALGASGKWTGGKLPVGMKSVRQKNGDKIHSYLIVDSDQIWRVKQLYELLLNGYTITKIERYCRDYNITSSNGKFLSTSQIYNIITNPVYCQADMDAYTYFQELGCHLPENTSSFHGAKGLIAYGRTHQNSTKRMADKSSWHITVGIHDYVIPSSEWIAAQNRLGINKQERSNKYQIGILKGVLRCKCGSRMANRVYTRNQILYGYYYCEAAFRQHRHPIQYYRIQEVDEAFLFQLKKIKLNPDFITLQKAEKTSPDPIVIQKKIRSTKAAIYNLTIQLQEHADSSAAKYIVSQMESLDAGLSVLNRQLLCTKLQEQTLDEEQQRDTIYRQICSLLEHFDRLDYLEKNELVKKILQDCTLDDNRLHIVL